MLCTDCKNDTSIGEQEKIHKMCKETKSKYYCFHKYEEIKNMKHNKRNRNKKNISPDNSYTNKNSKNFPDNLYN